MTNPLLAALGYPPDARLVLFHADDVGMCHGSNQAYFDLLAAGMVKSGSLMLPCPWSPEALTWAHGQPQSDLGVHLTLTSEWACYRWGPLVNRDPATGLLDEAGWFWQRPSQVQAHMQIEAAVAELRGQVEFARRAGLDFTHLDTHMGAALLPELLPTYLELGFANEVPVLLPRHIDDYARSLGLPLPEEAEYRALVNKVEARGMPLVDWFRITPGYHGEGGAGGRAELYETILHELPPGITFFSLHPNAPGDIETIVPERAYWRTFEYDYLQSDRLRTVLAAEQIVPIGFCEVRAVMRQWRS